MIYRTTVLSENLNELLKIAPGRFGFYQEWPPAVLMRLPELRSMPYEQKQIRLDGARYQWLLKNLPQQLRTATEIGANLGYFSLSLAIEKGFKVTAYEPIEAYAEVCQLLSEELTIAERLHCYKKGVCFKDLNQLNPVDLMIHLNVLHHAGSVYDIEAVTEQAAWRNYSINYLSELSKKSKYMLFQTGSMSAGKPLFPSDQALPFTYDLLSEAGWKIEAIGVIQDFQSMHYVTYPPEKLSEIKVTRCWRNLETHQVDYFQENKVVASLPTGLAQRPLWFCRSGGR